MTITEDSFMKRTRTSTFIFEPINGDPDPVEKEGSEEKQPGTLVGLLLRNKYAGIPIYTNVLTRNRIT